MRLVSLRGKSAESSSGSAAGRLLFQVGKILPTRAIDGGEMEMNKFVLSAYEA